MVLGIECLLLCLAMWFICFINTGSDKKNIKSFSAYPKALQDKLKGNDKYRDQIKTMNPIIGFISNFFTYFIIIFLLGIAFREKGNFLYNFVGTLILGQVLNLFDLLVIDLLWWRNTKRIRFEDYPEKELYMDPKEHLISFAKALVLFTLIALVAGALLMLF